VIELFRALSDRQSLFSVLAARAMDSAPETIETTYSSLRTRDECVQDIEEALSLAFQTNSQSGQAFVEMATSLVLSSFGEFGPALAHAQEALRIATTIEHQEWIVATNGALGQLYLLLLESDRAVACLEAALAGAQALGSMIWTGYLTPYLALAYLLRRAFPRAEVVLKAIMPREQQPSNFFERQAALVWGELALAQGEPAVALRIAEQLLVSAPGDARPQPIPLLLALKGEALLALKRLERWKTPNWVRSSDRLYQSSGASSAHWGRSPTCSSARTRRTVSGARPVTSSLNWPRPSMKPHCKSISCGQPWPLSRSESRSLMRQ